MVLTKPDKNWAWMVMFGSFGSHIVHGFFLYAIGILHVALIDRYGEDVSKTAWAGAIFLGLFCLTGPLASAISNRWNCRIAMIIGSFLMTTGFTISAFVTDLNWIMFTIGIISGTGAGLCYSTSVVVVGFNFEVKRNLASGIAVSGCGIGAFILSPLMQTARDVYGYTGFCLMCAGLSLQHMVFGSLFRPSFLEEHRKELHKQHMRKRKDPKSRFCEKVSSFFLVFKALKNKALLFLCLSLLAACFGIYLLYVHFAHFVIENGSTALQASFLLSISGLLNALSRFLMGVAANSDNINELLMYCGCFFVLGAMGTVFPLYGTSYTGQVIFVIALGMYSGCCYAILNTINIQVVGIKDLASAYGVEMFAAGIGALLGPPVAGTIVDNGGSYSLSFMIGGIAILLSAIFGSCIACFKEGADAVDGTGPVVEIDEKICQEMDIIKTSSGEYVVKKIPTDICIESDINSSNPDIAAGVKLTEQTTLFYEQS